MIDDCKIKKSRSCDSINVLLCLPVNRQRIILFTRLKIKIFKKWFGFFWFVLVCFGLVWFVFVLVGFFWLVF